MQQKFLKIFFFGLFFVGVFISGKNVQAANIYVDNTLENDCVTGNYSTANRTCTGSDGSAYNIIQNAIDAMNIGDKIYIRGGTYRENNGNSNIEIYIPTSLNGTSWNEGEYNYIGSYPGEWAIIDGERTAPGGKLLGNTNTYGSYSNCNIPTGTGSDLAYWKFERMEFTGGTSPNNDVDGGAAIHINGGPFIVRYNYFHDNWDTESLAVPGRCDNNPSAITLYRPHDSIFEFNTFIHNGCAGVNGDQVQIFSDYKDEAGGCMDLVDINNAVRKNIWRYNYFDGSNGSTEAEVGLKYKASQLLTDTDASYMTYKNYGDDIHHNIIKNHTESGTILRQDFIQFHHNILDGDGIELGQRSTWRRWFATVYNNTLLNGNILGWWDDSVQRYEFNDYMVNNILSGFDRPSATYKFIFQRIADNPIDNSGWVANEVVDRNYVYNMTSYTSATCGNGDPIRIGDASLWTEDSHFGCFTMDEYNAENGWTNWQKASSEGTDNLYAGSSGTDKYITRATHVVSGSTTISTGGISILHPYLSGVTIPSYLGATNPNDNAWVAGVLSLASVSNLQNASSGDPAWIEGSGDVTAPVAPSNLSVL